MSLSLSVIIPCYKEHEVIASSVLTIYEFLRTRFEQHEIIVVTDGSPDGTPAEVERLKKERSDIPLQHIAFPTNRGKGAAVRTGFLAARHEFVLMIDADLTISISELDDFLLAIERADMAIASRLVPGTVFEEPTPFHRVLTARIFHLLQILLLGNFEFSDTQCGFKLFRRERLQPLFQALTIERFAFDAELLFLARRMNLRVAILPVRIQKDARNTNVRLLSDSLNMFGSLLKIRWNESLGRYDQLSKISQKQTGSD
ncbi:MAG: glycosyltransferase [Candidatus Moraniibacteriota bacterium]